MSKESKPQIRFNEYDKDWHLHSLSDFATRLTRKNTDLVSELTMTISAQYGLISQQDFFTKRIASQDLSNYYLLNKGEFAYNKSYSSEYPWGAVKRLDRYEQGVVSNLYITFDIKDIDSNFIVSYFDTNKWHRNVALMAKEGARNHGLLNISSSDFLAIPLIIPHDNKESKEIGVFISNLDNEIQEQQKLCLSLKRTKDSLCKSLLYTQGSTTPSIRTKKFNGDWKLKKLSSIVNNYCVSTPTPIDGYMRLGIRSHGKGTFHEYVQKGEELDISNMWVVKANNLIVNITFGWELAVAITDKEDEGKLVSHRFPQYSFCDGYHPLFFRYALINEDFRKHLYLASPGSAGRNRVLKLDKMLEYEIAVPSYEEQIEIASILSHYDKLIDFNVVKLEKLRQLKSALLDKMFV